MDIEKFNGYIAWKNLFKTVKVPITEKTQYAFSKTYNRVYLVEPLEKQTQITCIDAKGNEVDKRSYSNELLSLYESNGLVFMEYYALGQKAYYKCQLSSTAATTSIQSIPTPANRVAKAPSVSAAAPTPVAPVVPETPVAPVVPETPVAPVAPTAPAVPETPVTPAAPAAPEEPAKNDAMSAVAAVAAAAAKNQQKEDHKPAASKITFTDL